MLALLIVTLAVAGIAFAFDVMILFCAKPDEDGVAMGVSAANAIAFAVAIVTLALMLGKAV